MRTDAMYFKTKVTPEIPIDISSNYLSSGLAKILLEQISQHNKSWAVVGGVPRSCVFGSKSKTNDIDITVNTDKSTLYDIVTDLVRQYKDLSIYVTKLGGYRLKSSEVIIDIWEAKKTVGIAKGKFKDTNLYRAVSKSAALSLDSLVVTSKGTVYEHGFFETLKTGVLRLNHSEIEQKKNIASKAIRLCNEFNLIPDIPLQSLIVEETSENISDISFGNYGSKLKLETSYI